MSPRALFRGFGPRLLAVALCLAGAAPAVAGTAQSSSLITVSMPVQLCQGIPPGSLGPTATEASVQLPSDLSDVASSLQAWGYAYGDALRTPAILISPPGFNCAASYGNLAGGHLNMTLAGPDDACFSLIEAACRPDDVGSYARSISATDRLTAIFRPEGAFEPLYRACPYFPSAQAEVTQSKASQPEAPDCDQLPADETVQQLGPEAVAFYEPPQSSGASTNPSFGVVLSTGSGATCTMSPAQSVVCETVLAAFLTGWVPRYSPSAEETAASANALEALPWFAGP